MSEVKRPRSMTRRRQVRIGVLTLAIAVQLAVLPRWFRQPATGEVSAAVAVGSAAEAPAQARSAAAETQRPVDNRQPWPSRINLDPFARVVVKPVAAPVLEKLVPKPSVEEVKRQAALELSLQGILLGQPSEAIINGRRYRAGQSIGRYAITAIDRRSVHLLVGEVAFTLEVGR